MNKELQRAQDMLGVMQHQRDQALNANVMLSAENVELRRQIVALEEQVGKLHAERETAQE